jgi:hypothetical protein
MGSEGPCGVRLRAKANVDPETYDATVAEAARAVDRLLRVQKKTRVAA